MRLARRVAASPDDTGAALDLAGMQERRGAIDAAEATLLKAAELQTSQAIVARALASLYSRTGRIDDAFRVLERAADQTPHDAPTHHLLATFYLQQATDPGQSAFAREVYLRRAFAAEDRALAGAPEFLEALVYKRLLVLELAAGDTDLENRRARIAEADALLSHIAAIRTASSAPAESGEFTAWSGPPPPPPPPVPGAGEIRWVYAEASYAVTGSATPTEPVASVRPVYPPMAIKLGIKGTVVVEAVLDSGGRVAAGRIVQSVPLLDQATIDAVRQWRFEAATPGTAGEPVLVTVTAEFTPPPALSPVDP